MHLVIASRRSSVLLFALALIGVGSTRAQWSGSPSINNPVIVSTTLNPLEPAMVSDGAGGALFLWRDQRNGSGNFDLFAQRLDANGARLWGDNGTAVTNVPGSPSAGYKIIADGAGGALLVWRDDRPSNNVPTKNVWVQRLDASGQAQWGANGRLLRADAILAGGGEGYPLFDDGAGGCYVITGPDGGSDNAHRVHRLTSAGVVAPGWPAGGVDLQQSGRPAAVVTDQPANVTGEHGIVVAMSIGATLTVRRVTASGSVGAALGIPTNSGLHSFQGASSDGAGGMFIVNGINANLFIFRVLANGTLAWSETDKRVTLAGGGTISGGAPVDVIPDGAGGAIVTWFGPSPGTSNWRMAAQRISPTGARLWGDNGIEVHTPAANTYYPGTSISDGAGGVIVSWGSYAPSEVRAQRLDASGNKLWPTAGVLISQPWGLTQLVSDQAGGAIYAVRVSANGGNSLFFGAKRTTLTGTLGTASIAGRLINMSIRTGAGTGDRTLIVGIGLGGAGTSGAKAVLIRGVGPTLTAFGVPGALADPVMTAFQGSTQIAQNDDWPGGFDFATVGAFAFSGAAPRDAAIYNPAIPVASYTIQIIGKNSGTGIALAEIYDATPATGFSATTPRLINVSARTQVGTGDNILIAGFVIGSGTPVRVLIRAVGPTLGAFGVGGVLADPKLEVFSGATKTGENDNWIAADASTFTSVGAFALTAGSRDAALVATLQPGNYTAQVSGVANTTGVALVEVYELP